MAASYLSLPGPVRINSHEVSLTKHFREEVAGVLDIRATRLKRATNHRATEQVRQETTDFGLEWMT